MLPLLDIFSVCLHFTGSSLFYFHFFSRSSATIFNLLYWLFEAEKTALVIPVHGTAEYTVSGANVNDMMSRNFYRLLAS